MPMQIMDRGSDGAGDSVGWVARQVKRTCKASKKSKTAHLGLRECYLRDDIPCGSPLCPHRCQGRSSLPLQASHYLIPDALALRYFWEILELPQLTAIIFLSSILKEVQTSLSLRHWKRLRSLFTDKRRGNLFFDDEHSVHTHESAVKGSRDGKVHSFGQWINEHLNFSVPIIIMAGLVEDNVESELPYLFQKSVEITAETNKNLKVLNVQEYVQCFWNQDRIVSDLCSSLVQSQLDCLQADKTQQGSQEGNEGQTLYKKHLPAIAIEEGLQDGSLLAGIFHAHKDSQKGGFVRPSNKGEATKMEVWVPAGKFQNRALHGDLVAVRVQPQNEEMVMHNELSGVVSDQGSSGVGTVMRDDEQIDILGLDLNIEESGMRMQKARFSGEVVGIVQRLQKDYSVCLHEMEEIHNQSMRQEHVICVPMDYRLPMVRVSTRQRSRLIGQRFVIRIDDWDADSKFPRGHVVRILGPIGELETENRAMLVENEINISPFCTGALKELPVDTEENPWCIPSSELAYRRDLRVLHRTYSIDPPGSKDVDDCLSIQHLDNNTLEIGVHIADVSHFVKNGSLLDLEAFSRATTVYLVGATYHMLPSILSENLCSLCQGKDRLAVSVIWTVDLSNEFEILKVWFGRTIIRSRQQMFYAQAQCIWDKKDLPQGWEILGGPDELEQVQSDLSLLANFAQVSKSIRESKGALELVNAEMRFEMGESQEPLNVETKTQLPMNWIVAELMIQANSYVARHIYQSLRLNTLLRRHPPPKQDNFDYLLKCCEARGVLLNTSSNKALASSLDNLHSRVDTTVQMAVKALATRAMSEAEYVAAGDVLEPYGFYHYGLALEFYTHFTSPIRRYADIVVHRMLTSLCGEASKEGSQISPNAQLNKRFTARELNHVSYHLNERHRASKKAQKECNELHLLMYLQKHAQAESAVVLEIQQYKLLVYVPKYDLKGQVHLQDKTGKVILPAKDDKCDDEIALAHIYGNSYALESSENSISIVDGASKVVIQEYKRMCSIWIQMKADGSRAHSPTLRLRLLSQQHPVVLEAMLQTNMKLEHPKPQKFPTSLEINAQRLRDKEEKKLIHDKNVSKQTTNDLLMKPTTVYAEKTLHEILAEHNNRSPSGSSVYLDDKDCEMACSQGSTVLQIPKNFAFEDFATTTGLSASSSILSSAITVSPENPQIGDIRKAWQRKLVKAAVQHTKQLRLIDPDDSLCANMRKLKARKAQEEAYLLYGYIESS